MDAAEAEQVTLDRGRKLEELVDAWTDDRAIEAFARINRGKSGIEWAPHKPLLLLLALAQLQRGCSRLTAYDEIHDKLIDLLEGYGPSRAARHPEQPFWRLRNDGIWEVTESELIAAETTTSGDAKVSVLRRVNAKGGFPEALHEYLSGHPGLVSRLTQGLLERTLPASRHESLLDEIAMPWVVSLTRRRDPNFRELVLDVYAHRCAVCGFDGRLGPRDLAIEAAHVKWHAAGGPDQIDNGLALCTFHHKALDRGAIGISEDHKVLVSEKVSGQTMVDELMYRFAWQSLRSPKPGRPRPAADNVRWHREQVFRGPEMKAG